MNSRICILLLISAFLFTLNGCEEKRILPDAPETEFVRYNQHLTLVSKSLGKEVTFSVLFPKMYREEQDARYPVVYMLHGYGESGKDWTKWVSAINSMENGGLQPMIYVFPNCANSYFCNTHDGRALYMDMIVDELVPFVDRSYRTVADRDHRAVMGYSMGGFGAMALALKNPDVFGMSVPLSMSFRTDEQYMTESQDGWDNQWGSIFGGRGQAGAARLTDYYKSHCPFYQFVPENLNELSKVKWFLHCGDDEEQLLIANDNLHVQMRDYGYEHEFRIGDGGHSGDYWRNAARETLPWIEHVMKGSGEWTKSTELTPKTSVLNEDGTFSSAAYNELKEKSGLAIYLVHKGFSKELVDQVVGRITQSGSKYPYMVLPCDLDVKPLNEWMTSYQDRYKVGTDLASSHVIAYGEAGRDVYAVQELFSAYYFVDADLAEDESVITADADKYYYIDQTDDSINYHDMNALYRACKKVLREDGSYTEADFEYRMRNGVDDMQQSVLLAAKSIADNIKYQ